MCGIYGIVGIDFPNRLTLARALAVFNEQRGEHSSGIAIVREGTLRTEISKRAIAPTKHVYHQRYAQLASANYRTLIGHTRWATHGAICDQNAHPFTIGSTTGVHNGVISNTKGMRRFTGKDYEVDSQYLIYCLDEFGHLGPAQGSANVAFFGPKDPADLRIIRSGNPLSVAMLRNGKGFVFSSLEEDLANALCIAGLRADIDKIPDGEMWGIFIRANGQIELEMSAAPYLPKNEAEPFHEYVPVRQWYEYKQIGGSYSNAGRVYQYDSNKVQQLIRTADEIDPIEVIDLEERIIKAETENSKTIGSMTDAEWLEYQEQIDAEAFQRRAPIVGTNPAWRDDELTNNPLANGGE